MKVERQKQKAINSSKLHFSTYKLINLQTYQLHPMRLSESFYFLKNALQSLYDTGEATAITHEYLRHLTHLGKLERIMQKDESLSPQQEETLNADLQKLLKGKPLQYVTGCAFFLGDEYAVDENVLIPRPETEELVLWAAEDFKSTQSFSVLDIGTGSGCIPISLKKNLPQAVVSSCDVSDAALQVARKNAAILKAEVSFFQCDFLNRENWKSLPAYDLIISNPPYIPFSEKLTLHQNVRDFEPSLALFVTSDDPLLFYYHLAAFAKNHLQKNGALFCETHRDFATPTVALFKNEGFKTYLRKDMHGAERMIKCIW